jgi:acyl-CoA synthetase (AMP-forming)/AMP-acid ligase II
VAASKTPPRFASPRFSVAWLLGAESLPEHVDPGKCALVWEDGERTYLDLRNRALALGAALREHGLEPGDRVMAHLLNRGETFELYFACAYAGLTFVPVNWRFTERELRMIVDDCSPKLIFTQARVAESMRGLAREQSIATVVLEDHTSGDQFERLAQSPPLDGPYEWTELQLILYTSGTTGRPKGVMITQDNLCFWAYQQAFVRQVTGDSRTLIVSPTFNVAGISELTLPAWLAGATICIHRSGGWTPEGMAAAIDRWGATHSIIYPSMMEPLLQADARRRIEFASLRWVLTGGENCPPATIARFRERWSHVSVALGYGATETCGVTLIRDDEIGRHPGSVGRVESGIALRIEDPDGREVGAGEVGEIVVAGPGVVKGYWNADAINDVVLKNGWWKTGDLGFQDADGYVYLAGRSKEVIISKGQNIYPAEIENVLSENDDLLESAIVGLPDSEWGEMVCAAVVAKPGREVTGGDVVEFLTARLASYKKPRHVVFLDGLPRNPGRKVVKSELEEIVARQLSASAD